MSVVAKSRARELTREDVIDAAAELVAERGYDGLSMRALAQRCGVATMTLYRHVRTKEDLLGALTDRVLSDLLLEHPDLVEIAARQHVAGEAAYRGAEVVLDALRRAGIEGESAASAFATLFAFTLGFTQQQRQPSGSGPGAGLAHRQAVLERLPVDDFENLSRLGGVFLLRHSDRHFDDGLDLIIRGLASKAKTRAKGQR